MQTKNGLKKVGSGELPTNSKKTTSKKEDNKDLEPSKTPVQMLDFNHINENLNIQFSDGNKYVVDPSIVGQVVVDKKVILITRKCEMTFQYMFQFGYELPVYIDGDDEPVMMISLKREELTKAKTGRTEYLYEVLGKNILSNAVKLRATQLSRYYNEGRVKVWDYKTKQWVYDDK